MAYNLPNQMATGLDPLLKGFAQGTDLYHKLMTQKTARQVMPSGDVANAVYIDQLRQKYGDNSPIVLEAQKAHQMGLDARQSLIGYRDVLNQKAPYSVTSPLGKLMAEGKGQGALNTIRQPGNILQNAREGMAARDAQGMENNTNVDNGSYEQDNQSAMQGQLSPEEKEAYERSINKQTSDSAARNILLRAENLDKTRKSINVNDLVQYSGLRGTASYLKDAALATGGTPPERFIKNQEAITAASLMADQMRQFYGDSIQPSAMDRLRSLSNPATWYKNPDIAKKQFESLNKILDQETETYRNAGTSPVKLNKIDYKDGKFMVSKDNKAANEEQGTVLPNGDVRTPDGEILKTGENQNIESPDNNEEEDRLYSEDLAQQILTRKGVDIPPTVIFNYMSQHKGPLDINKLIKAAGVKQ